MSFSQIAAKACTGGSSGSDVKFVGNVTNGSSFPTTRLDGSALKEGDYVRPKTGSTFPFVIGSVTFTSTRDKAIYSTAGWMIDPGALQDTVETPVKDKSVESLSGNATTQYAINSENKTAINNKAEKDYVDEQDNKKIDKIDGAVSIEHAVVKKADGTYGLMQVNINANAGLAIVRRDLDKQINVPLEPLADDDAASKKYVDEHTQVMDSALSDTSINGVQNKVIKAAIDAEATARSNADTTLQTNITNEQSARQTGDVALQNNIDAEATARANADTAITNTLTTHTSNTSNPHNVTKAQVGLDQVNNTSDADKPISTATQDALDAEILARTNADTAEAGARETKDDDLQEQINNLSTMGRYLSTWNCVTGKPATEPTTPLPYNYKAGDYYIINGVGVTNYRPSGTQYTGEASTTVETAAVANNGYYQFDGATWIYLEHTSKSVGFKDLTGTARENTDLKNELNAKQDVLTAGDAIEIDTSNKIRVKTSTTIPEEGQVDTKVPTEKAVADFVYGETGNYLPLSGGEMTGAITSSKTEFLALGADMGAAMNLYGGERGGKFEIATNTTELTGNDSSLKWGDKEVLREDMITHDSSTGIITFNF